MRRSLAIILAVIYIGFTSGVVLSTHYCMGEVAGVALGSSGADVCGTCGMENDGCCHDDVQVVKLTTDHATVATPDVPAVVFIADEAQWDLLPEASLAVKNKEQVHIKGPPLAVSRNVLYCVYRI